MFHVMDHADVVYTGELSQTTQYVMEHYGRSLDDAIRSGIRITYADPRLQWNEIAEAGAGRIPGNFWQSVEDWEID